MDENKPRPVGRPPIYDYDSVEWYTAITRLAMQGCTNQEIAYGLEDELHIRISPVAFGDMVRGHYSKWDEETNERRSKELVYVLEHARNRLNSIVRGRFLKSALGGEKIKNTSTTRRRMQIDGQLTDNELIQTTENEMTTQPDRAALATWLYHHDPEWRKIQRGKDEDEANELPEADKGVDIARWIDLENAIHNGGKELEEQLYGTAEEETGEDN